jgi:transposase
MSIQFVGQMDRPSTSLNSNRSRNGATLRACVITSPSREGHAHHKLSSYSYEEVSMEQYIGIDVAKEELSVFDGTNERIFQNRQGLSTFRAYLRKAFPDLCKVVLIFEATGPYSQYLIELCASHGIKAWVVNPKKSSHFAKALGNRSKTDPIYAETLYTFSKVVDPKDILVPQIDHVREELSLYLSSYDFVIKTQTAIANRIEALSHHPHTPKELLVLLRHDLARAEKIEARLLARMEELIKADGDISRDYENLLTIPGIGKICAITLLAFFRTYGETKRSEITALVGLDPTRKESGTSVNGRRKISKGGNKRVRKVLYFPTLSAIQHNSKIRTFYERLVANHKPKKLAVIASMRKLVLIAHAVYKNKTPYQEAA